jgi:nucleoside-diphosphate-sugar epimerase
MYKFFIPGGAGYIGSQLTEQLLSEGHKVSVLDNFYYSQSSLIHLMRHPNLKVIHDDFRNKQVVESEATKADVIIPLAALVGAPLCDREPDLSREVNVDAPLNLFKSISNQQILIMPTTNSAYGSGEANNFCDESTPLRPISTYAKMKVEVEKALMEKENAISFRLATVFGISSRMRLDLLVNDFTYRAMRDKKLSVFEGHFKRNYIHILDVVRVFLHGVHNSNKMSGQIYNVGLSDTNISKLELCSRIKKQIPELKFEELAEGKDPDQRNYMVSNAKLDATGFKTIFSLDQGISEIIQTYPQLHSESMRNIK